MQTKLSSFKVCVLLHTVEMLENHQMFRAARLQNETAPGEFQIDTKKIMKNAREDPKNNPKRV